MVNKDPRPGVAGGVANADSVFEGGGELGALMRAKDWSQTPLGPPGKWPRSLKTCVRIVLTSRQPMFVWWGESLVNLYNDAYKAIVGGKHPEALGQPASVVWREIWDEVRPRAASALRNNEGTYDEALLLIMERYGYQEETYYTFSYSPVPNDEGGIGGIICANTDDTQRIISERQLALLRDLAAKTADARTWEDACALSASALATNARDLPFALVYLLDSARKTVTLAGRAGMEAAHPAAPASATLDQRTVWPFAEVLRSHEVQVVDGLDELAPLPSGAWPRPPVRAAVLPIPAAGDTGRPGVLVVGLNPFRQFDRDYRGFLELAAGQISASVANALAYEQEKKRAEALAEIDRAKTIFFSNVSHEFRTPLTLMLGPAEDLLSGTHGALPALQRAQVELLHRNALRLQKLVNSLLDFSRIEAGRIQASFEPVDLGALTRDLASVFRSAVDRAGLSLTLDCPSLGEPVYVDRDMWEKIVLNLLSNALKFTFEGRIEVSLRSSNGTVALRVADTGVGVPQTDLPRLFERFHRVEGTRARTHEGSGIGLALVHELVKIHGGTIRAESKVGAGTSFTVVVPKGSAHLPKDRIRAARTLASTAVGGAPFVEEALRWLPGAGVESDIVPVADEGVIATRAGERDTAPARILLADDNADVREYVRRLLAQKWTVEAVPDGAQACAAARARPPDLVISDVMMPNLDGFGMLRELRADPLTRSIPVILLSARAGEEAKIEGLHAGADDYIVKPFSARELFARVEAHIELSRLRAAAEAERAKLRALFMNAPAIICILRGPDHVFELANPLYRRVVSGRDVVGKRIRDALPELEGQGYYELLDDVYRTGKTHLGNEARVQLAVDGSEGLSDIFVNFVYQPSHAPDGKVDGVLVFAFDVTDQVLARRKVEEEHQAAEAARAQAEAAVRVRDDFLSIAAHELRTPLTTLKLQTDGALRLLNMDGATVPPRFVRHIQSIRRSGDRLAQLVEGLLDVSRIAVGRLEVQPEDVDLSALAREVCDRFDDEAARLGCTIELRVHGPVSGRWDPLRLDQVLTNLLSNAIKYGEGKPIEVDVEATPSTARVRVHDHGIGIDGEHHERIFGRFERAVSGQHFGGLGLGLWISRQVVAAMGGRIWVASRPGEGASFTVELPREVASAGAQASAT